MSTTLAIAPNTLNHESHVAGNSSLGPFTYRGLWADDPGSQSSGSCGSGFGPNFRIVAGAGVFRFEDGSLLTVQLTEGTLCVDIADPAHPVGRQFETYQITGGTGRFRHAAASCGVTAGDCPLQLTATRGLVLRDSSGAPKFFTFTGEFREPCPISATATSCHSTSQGTGKGHWQLVRGSAGISRDIKGRAHGIWR